MQFGKAEKLNEIFRLLSEQRELLQHWPYSRVQIKKDQEISAHIRELVDQICVEQSATSALAEVDFEELVPSKL